MGKIALILILFGTGLLLPLCQEANTEEDFSTDHALSAAQEPLSQEVVDISNQVMLAIYDDIFSGKHRYINLADFGRHTLTKNRYGIYSIEYKHEITEEGYRKGQFLMFGVTIVKLEDTDFDEFGRKAFHFNFPLLGLKFAGYGKTNRERNQFEIQKVVQKNGDPILREQVKRLPLKLSLETVKESYAVDESIKFVVTLENVSSKGLRIRDLNEHTLYFLYGNTPWGTFEVGENIGKKAKRIVLEPGGKIRKTFTGSGFSSAQEVEIYCSYVLTFKGVKPSSILKIKIVK